MHLHIYSILIILALLYNNLINGIKVKVEYILQFKTQKYMSPSSQQTPFHHACNILVHIYHT